MARRRRHRRHSNPVRSSGLGSEIIPIAIGVVGGGLAVYLWMKAALSSSQTTTNQLAASATGSSTTGS